LLFDNGQSDCLKESRGTARLREPPASELDWSPLIFETIYKRLRSSSSPGRRLPFPARRTTVKMEFERYLDALASADPTPGGGSAATLVGALAAALCAMVARITAAAPKHAAARDAALAIAADGDALRAAFLGQRPADEAAFGAVVTAQALPRASAAEKAARTVALQAALTHAAAVPLGVAALAVDAFALTERTAALGNSHLASDVACALHFARAALDASAENVRVNHHYLRDAATIDAQRARLAALEASARAHEQTIRASITTPTPGG
jgi:formiminotetrahydrofolate cyclodeaminase